MKKYHYIIIEIKEDHDKFHVTLWAKYHKSKKKLAKKIYRDLKKHCSTNSQFISVKVKEKK